MELVSFQKYNNVQKLVGEENSDTDWMFKCARNGVHALRWMGIMIPMVVQLLGEHWTWRCLWPVNCITTEYMGGYTLGGNDAVESHTTKIQTQNTEKYNEGKAEKLFN